MTMSKPIPSSREQLWGILAEAAEIEHNLMCCYLYAYFSLKDHVDEGVTSEELDAIRRWRAELLDVAIEEMGHLAIVSNILSSVGAPAHFWRQNFPIAAGYHPAGVVVKLAPFNPETLDHFIYLERPESVTLDDGAGFNPEINYTRTLSTDRLMSATFDYTTVGQLYASIEDGILALAASMGEEALFVGDAGHQLGPDTLSLSNLAVVRCTKSACAAIDAIVRQGEGSDPNEAGSHYQRFLAIRNEYQKIIATRPDFQPGRMAAHNPLMRRPPNPEGKIWVDAEPAASLLDFGNAIYNHSLRCLALAYSGVSVADQRTLVNVSIELMKVLSPVASRLTRLPASSNGGACTAGLSFATSRFASALPDEPGGMAVLAERLLQISARGNVLASSFGDIAGVTRSAAVALAGAAKRLKRAPSVPVNEAKLSPPEADGQPPLPEPQGDGVEIISGKALDLIFEAKRCIHSRHCVLEQPKVFKANVEGPWIDPDATSTEALITTAHMCPSGAIRYRRKDGGEGEVKPPVNLVQLRENGPLGIRAEIILDGEFTGMRATLCRCGASKNKPYCDGSHNEIAFIATSEPPTRACEALAERDGSLSVDPEIDGPLSITGNLELCTGTGRTFDRVRSVKLCRCGGSANKPFCDGTHRRNGFRS